MTADPLITSNHYDGPSPRLLSSRTAGQPATTYHYDAGGQNIGATRGGVTSLAEAGYLVISGELWRADIRTDSAGGVTNGVTTHRAQLTGLSDRLRSRSVTIAANGGITTSETAYDAATKTLTATTRRDGATPAVTKSRCGMVVESRGLGENTRRYYDAFRKLYHVREFNPDGGLRTRYLYTPYTATWDTAIFETKLGNDRFEEWVYYDAWGREVERVDFLGNAVTNGYDQRGRLVATGGATYPLRHGHDSAGRRTTLRTTRDGTAWDATRWNYDAATGLATNKLYADNGAVNYTYTPDGKLATRTWARGITTAYGYDLAQNLTAISYRRASGSADPTPGATLAYDSFRRLQAASNGVAAYSYAIDPLSGATNEAAVINGTAFRLHRTFDHRHRLAGMSDGGTATHYGYDSENRLATVSNAIFTVAYAHTPDNHDAGHTITTASGATLTRSLTRDPYRRHLVTAIINAVNGIPVNPLTYTYDLLNRVTRRNQDTFAYNPRSEVTAANIQPAHTNRYEYDNIGNAHWTTNNGVGTAYLTNPLNQYTNILRASAPPRELEYDPDGNLTNDGAFSYTYDAENRLVAVYNDSALVISNAYDHQSRRILKVTPNETRTFFYDGWNLIQETITTSTSTTTNHYIWGKDLSGTLQGAGGVGGLLAVSVDNSYYFPLYDNNGNITAYVDDTGIIVAEYRYDAFGNTISQSGPMADSFPHRFSTKYYDHETSLYYYGYRFYSPVLMRWLNRDPIGERGGMHIYAMMQNNLIASVDYIGLWEILLMGEWPIDEKDTVLKALNDIKKRMPSYMESWRTWAQAVSKLPKDCEYKTALQQDLTKLYSVLQGIKDGMDSSEVLRIYRKKLPCHVDARVSMPGRFFHRGNSFDGNLYLNINVNNHLYDWSYEEVVRILFHELSHVANVLKEEDLTSEGLWSEYAYHVEELTSNEFNLELAPMVSRSIDKHGSKCCPPKKEWMPK